MTAHLSSHEATVSDVADHIDHVRKVAGIDYVGVGGDYEGFDGPPDGLEDVSCYPALFAELLRRGYTPEDVKKVAGLNILRVMRQVEGRGGKNAERRSIKPPPEMTCGGTGVAGRFSRLLAAPIAQLDRASDYGSEG